MNVTVISPCYKRFENYERILQAWLNNKEVDELIVLDNSGNFKTSLPVRIENPGKNLGPQGKYPLALTAKNDLVIFGDDDILVREGLVSDLLAHWEKGCIIGILGRVFKGDKYYDSDAYWGADIDKPKKVDWLGGGCTLAHKELCDVDPEDCPSMTLDDIWWESHFRDTTDFFVTPTNKYEFLPENWDAGALHSQPEIKPLRDKYAKEWGFIK